MELGSKILKILRCSCNRLYKHDSKQANMGAAESSKIAYKCAGMYRVTFVAEALAFCVFILYLYHINIRH
jgi:hypothetical protein